jgi:lysophospholipase L1-like esterase
MATSDNARVTGGPAAAPPIVLTTRRKILFGGAAFILVALSAVAGFLALDVYLRHRARGLGLNAWGYRGAAAGRKQPGEARIAALGGSTVFGYGVAWTEAWPFYLERRINASPSRRQRATLVNLGMPRDSAATFADTLDDYAYLKSDLVIFYEGYNDLDSTPIDEAGQGAVAHYLSWRHQSPIFRWTGYFPILPLVLNEKAMQLMHGGDLNAAYDSRAIVFRPGLATRVTAGALKATADMQLALERRFGRLTDAGAGAAATYDSTCGRWSQYCGAVQHAVRHARDRGQRVIVVTQPYLSDLHIDQQRALAASLRREFAGDSRVRRVDLGQLLDLHDPQVAYDGLHLTSSGNERIAAALAPAVLEMLQ